MTDASRSPDEPHAEGDHSHLAQRAVAGVRWGLVSTSSQQILRVVFTIALARMIGPNDFGIAATAAIYVGVTQLFIDSGFGAALVQKEEIDDDDVGSVFWINMFVGAVDGRRDAVGRSIDRRLLPHAGAHFGAAGSAASSSSSTLSTCAAPRS